MANAGMGGNVINRFFGLLTGAQANVFGQGTVFETPA
jgi:hypothetical protein